VSAELPLAWLARALNELGMAYAVIGAHAVNAWIEPRFTADIDVTIEFTAESAAELAIALERAGFKRERAHAADAGSGPDFVRFVCAERALTVEFQAAKTEFQREVVRRARAAEDGTRVATVEDLIVLKLIADRPKDQIDLLGLAALPGVDWAYVERWAREWEIGDRLRALRGRAAR
jgi:hypothetical protein